jgi:hypothetical protein
MSKKPSVQSDHDAKRDRSTKEQAALFNVGNLIDPNQIFGVVKS